MKPIIYGAAALALVWTAGCGSDGDGEGAGPDTAVEADGVTGDGGVADGTDEDSGSDEVDAGGGDVDATEPPFDVDLDGDVEPGTFGAPCQSNLDCFSGFCVEGPEGYICTENCQETCPAGFDCKAIQNRGDVSFLCLPRLEKLCTPCTQDHHCTGGACLEIDGVQNCAAACDGDEDCPEGWACGEDPLGRADGSFCVPVTGSCACNAEVDGGQRTCTNSNDLGTCFGVETCDQETGWGACTAEEPVAEVCDGVDNDCNGLADDGLEGGDTCEISNEFGTCSGTRTCVGSQGWVCDAREPQAETCNGLDDDCDGQVDEDFKAADGTWTLDAHCGGCFNACADKFPNATGTCGGTADLPQCVVESCDEGLVKINDFLCSPPVDPSCAPCDTDADCFGGTCTTLDGQDVCVSTCGAEGACPDGFACEAVGPDEVDRCVPVSGSCTCNEATAGAKRTCSVENPVGTCFGVETCDPEQGWMGCTAPTAEGEVCDGQDNDCDGLIDEELSEGQTCTNEVEGVGACEGVTVCLGPQGEVCQAPTPEVEICDFKDNDCDGQVDEDFKTDGVYADFDHCGTCNSSCGTGFPNATSTSCLVTSGQAQCVVDECAEGYSKLNSFQCVPDAVSLCSPCAEDDNCLGSDAYCVELDEGTFCGRGCETTADCPGGYECQDVGEPALQCVPSTGSCGCDGSNLDLSRTCSVTYTPDDPDQPEYTCNGVEQCTADGWGGCDLPDDICDGQDNDCNGQTDESFKNAEGVYDTVQHCGGCGISCLALEVDHATPVCSTSGAVPACSFDCDEGWVDVDGVTDNGCECQPQAGPDVAGDSVDSNCDGIDGELNGAVFVAKDGDDAQPGTREAPLLTIAAGIQRAFDEGKTDVYVATGVYSESVELVDGIRVYGGYSSDFFQHNTVTFETAIIGQDPTDALPGAVTAVGVGAAEAPEPTVLDGFTVFGANAANVIGANSYALYLRNAGSQLQVRNNRIFGGAGGNGPAGAQGDDGIDGASATPGTGVTETDTRSCSNSSDGTAGGVGGETVCSDGAEVSGGDGGEGRCPVHGDPPEAQEVGATGQGPAPGDGGAAAWDLRFDTSAEDGCSTCNTPPDNAPFQAGFGTPGQQGQDGSSGSGCADVTGQVVDGHWRGTSGAGGGAGAHGSGGGGGGAGAGVEVQDSSCWLNLAGDDIGGTGGGGGAGGCAGRPGTGGQAGGGSFSVFVTFDGDPASYPILEGNAIRPGAGGAGGSGGPGGAGGTAGAGAPGGQPTEGDGQTWCATGGGEGGNGGRGGHGGGGGGGCGGVSYGIFAWPPPTGSVADAYEGNQFLPGGQGGQPGPGGPSLGSTGESGSAGETAPTNF
ncbi:MAG: MopE-related protein [Myxococcota bacterium]